MDTIKKGKVISCLATIFFGVCSIIGFTESKQQYGNYSIHFGTVFCCFTCLWAQVSYRISTLTAEQIAANSKESILNMKNFIYSTLQNSDFTFQIVFCQTLAIILSYCSIGYFCSEDFYKYLQQVIRYCDRYRGPNSTPPFDFASFIGQFQFMIIFSILLGVYLQIKFIIKIFFKIFDTQSEQTLIIKLNLNLKDTELQLYQKSIVYQSIFYICLWILLFTLRLILYYSYYYEYYFDHFEKSYQQNFLYFLYIQTGCFIIYCVVILIFLIQILLHIKNSYLEVISQNNENFSSWLLLISSLVYSNRMKIFSYIVLGLMLVESIFGNLVLNIVDFILTIFNLSDNVPNVLIADTLTITVFTFYKFLDLLLIFLFPQSHPPPAKYNFTIQQIIYQVQTVEINENQNYNLTPQTPGNGGGKLT